MLSLNERRYRLGARRRAAASTPLDPVTVRRPAADNMVAMQIESVIGFSNACLQIEQLRMSC